MFGSLEHSNIVQLKVLAAPGDQENATGKNLRSESSPGMMTVTNSALQQVNKKIIAIKSGPFGRILKH